jgi:HSP20 family protein
MNALKHWTEWKDMEAFQHGLDSVSHHPSPRRPSAQEFLPAATAWSPLVDISEDEQQYLIKAELPEVNKEDVKVTAEAGALTIMGERRFEKEEKGRKYHRIERAYGNFGRTFSLPDDVSPNKVTAEFKDGLLTVHLMKDAKAKPQQIEVTIS